MPRCFGGRGLFAEPKQFQNAILTDSLTGKPTTINQPTVLGRVGFPLDENREAIAARYHGAERGIGIRNAPSVSKNHAVLAFEDGGWKVFDLASEHGTYVNGFGVGKRGMALEFGDTLQLADRAFVFALAEIERNIALLVGNSGTGKGRLRGVKNDLRAMEKTLRTRGCFAEVAVMQEEKATRDAVLRFLEYYARPGMMGDNSLFMFYYSGHGDFEEIITRGRRLHSNEVYPILGRMGGEKFLLLDCCRAASFTLAVPERTMVIGAADKKGLATEGPDILSMSINGALTRAFISEINGGTAGKVNLSLIARRMAEHKGLVWAGERVFTEGPTLYI
jgi:pSer/pThr/pTyr-binding forkhead associated (FHA) protein